MLNKLEKKTLSKLQLFGYILTLFVGSSILLLTIQAYFDVKPLLENNTQVFKNNTAVISKKITVFKSLDKERVYFTEEELADLKAQNFVKDITAFTSANFKISAYSDAQDDLPGLYSALFFESIPSNYLDVESEDWKWDSATNFLPIVIPEDYLKLYNFGFAESQELPVLSKKTISLISFSVRVSGKGKVQTFDSKIVGYSNTINSILVPEEFLEWANQEYGDNSTNRISRVLVDFKNPSDENILKYFNENNYSINKEKLEMGKLAFFFKSTIFIVFFISIVIVLISIFFLILSLNLLFQKNKTIFINLYVIGYSIKNIAKFYQITVAIITVLTLLLSSVFSNYLRNSYLSNIKSFIDFESDSNFIFWMTIGLIILLTSLYSVYIVNSLKRIIKNSFQK